MDISVIVPLYNEEESLPELHAWIRRVMSANNFPYEIIFVNDGSTDGTRAILDGFAALAFAASFGWGVAASAVRRRVAQ